jgi:hypothetical protein
MLITGSLERAMARFQTFKGVSEVLQVLCGANDDPNWSQQFKRPEVEGFFAWVETKLKRGLDSLSYDSASEIMAVVKLSSWHGSADQALKG